MPRAVRLLSMAGLGLGLCLAATFAACKGDSTPGCQSDGDCPTSYICRDNACGPTDQSNVTSARDDGGPGSTCANDNATCTVDDDCCGRTCTNNLCIASTSPSQPTCAGLSSLCQNDCCVGLTCVKGVCQ